MFYYMNIVKLYKHFGLFAEELQKDSSIKCGVTVLGNVWGVTVDHNGLYWTRMVVQLQVMPGVLLWIIMVSTEQGWWYNYR